MSTNPLNRYEVSLEIVRYHSITVSAASEREAEHLALYHWDKNSLFDGDEDVTVTSTTCLRENGGAQ